MGQAVKNSGLVLAITALFMVLLPGLAQAAGDVGNGRALYGSCVACHGGDGQGNPALNAPALAGQDADYLARQLQHFKSGIRGTHEKDRYGQQMRPMTLVLGGNQDIQDVAAYLAELPATASAEALSGNLRNGENQYNGACGACHGAQAQGNPMLHAPRLSGLDSAYLRRQYDNFAAGIRGGEADDRFGRQMKMMATTLSTDKDINDVIYFIVTQGNGG